MTTASNEGERHSLVAREMLETHLDEVHAIGSERLLATLLPAIEIAWADGAVHDHERELILDFAKNSGLSDDHKAMQRVHDWLVAPPSNQDCRQALEQLREMSHHQGQEVLVEIFTRAEAVARADGGVLGFGSICPDEQRALHWIESAMRSRWDNEGTRPDGLSPLARVLEVFWELLVDRSKADTVHRNVIPSGEHTMWPQPSPWGADRFAPAVLGVPEREYREYMEVIVERYLRSLKQGWWDAICHAAMRPGVAPMSDAELGELIYGAPFARFLCPHFDAPDRASFGDLIAEAEAIGVAYKVDMRHLEACDPLPGVELVASAGLFALRGDGALVPVALEIDGRVFRPHQGESWERARYFFVQGCAVSMVLGAHPHLHFPLDSVIGVTREVVPPEHPLARVIEAHAWLHLPLDYGVCYNARSVAHNHQREIYTPFPVRRDDIFAHIVSPYYVGVPEVSARPGYRYPMAAPEFPGPYCEFLGRYFDVLLEFCREVAAVIPSDDPIVARWGGPLHELIPGFPSVAELREREILARAICGFVHTVSVWHSADHQTYSSWPVNKVPQRLRVPPPTGDDEPIPQRQWVRTVDVVRQEIARRLFYEAHTVRGILEVDYGFDDPGLVAATKRLHAALRACDREQPIRYIPLDRIACSLQF